MILNLIQFQASHFDLKSVGPHSLCQLSIERLKVRRAGDNSDNNQTFGSSCRSFIYINAFISPSLGWQVTGEKCISESENSELFD